MKDEKNTWIFLGNEKNDFFYKRMKKNPINNHFLEIFKKTIVFTERRIYERTNLIEKKDHFENKRNYLFLND